MRQNYQNSQIQFLDIFFSILYFKSTVCCSNGSNKSQVVKLYRGHVSRPAGGGRGNNPNKKYIVGGCREPFALETVSDFL